MIRNVFRSRYPVDLPTAARFGSLYRYYPLARRHCISYHQKHTPADSLPEHLYTRYIVIVTYLLPQHYIRSGDDRPRCILDWAEPADDILDVLACVFQISAVNKVKPDACNL